MPPVKSHLMFITSQGKTLAWASSSQLVGVELSLRPRNDARLSPQYAVALHAWLLNQVGMEDPELSAEMHDNQVEKKFSMSRLQGLRRSNPASILVSAQETYRWQVNGFSMSVVQWLQSWLGRRPSSLRIYDHDFAIEEARIALPATTYDELWAGAIADTKSLHFLTPTSFRRHGNHVPLPNPTHLFHSYLRRWNQQAERTFEAAMFLDWVDRNVVICRHELSSTRVSGGKRGLVTGFLGSVELGLARSADRNGDFVRLFNALCDYAPYCGTGHKTPFGLGHTRAGWVSQWQDRMPAIAEITLADRIDELTAYFVAFRQKTARRQVREVAEKWAQVMARREIGDSLSEIATDMDVSYESAKTYSKLARRALRDEDLI